MNKNVAADPEALRSATYASLTCRAITDQARGLVAELYTRIVEHERSSGARKKRLVMKADQFRRAIEGFLGDLLLAQARERGTGWVFRSGRRESFSHGEVSYRHFTRMLDALLATKRVERVEGYRFRGNSGSLGGRGWAARFRATERLLKMAQQFGVSPENVSQHFITKPPPQPLQARKRSTKEAGTKLAGGMIDWRKSFRSELVEEGEKLEAEVRALNEFLDKTRIGGAVHRGYVRIYNNSDDPNFNWNKGGRLYSAGKDNYQHVAREERLGITLNGEPVCEIDIRASYLTIFYAWYDTPLNLTRDPYVLPGLGEEARPAVKAWFVATFGSEKQLKKWPRGWKTKFQQETGLDPSAYPLKRIREAAIKAHPVMRHWGTKEAKGDWASLMWHESAAMVATMLDLMRTHNVPSLTMWDSLLVPASKRSLAEKTLTKWYQSVTRVRPKLVTYP